MKICLISPPYNSAVKSMVGVSSPPLGLAYLASVLRDNHEVRIIDSNILDYSMEDVRRELKDFYPDIVGITSVTPSTPQAYAVAKMAKDVRLPLNRSPRFFQTLCCEHGKQPEFSFRSLLLVRRCCLASREHRRCQNCSLLFALGC